MFCITWRRVVNKGALVALFVWCTACYGGVHHRQAVDPLSKIVVTSTDALCTKNSGKLGLYTFQYRNNVHVTFADQSTITADFLEIVLDTKKADTHKSMQAPDLNNFKQITLTGNVRITSTHRKASADTARVFLTDQRVVLEGNVKIWQTKQKAHDIPVVIESSKAELSLRSGQAHLLGNAVTPVSTTIVLRDQLLPRRQSHSSTVVQHGSHSSTSTSRSA